VGLIFFIVDSVVPWVISAKLPVLSRKSP